MRDISQSGTLARTSLHDYCSEWRIHGPLTVTHHRWTSTTITEADDKEKEKAGKGKGESIKSYSVWSGWARSSEVLVVCSEGAFQILENSDVFAPCHYSPLFISATSHHHQRLQSFRRRLPVCSRRGCRCMRGQRRLQVIVTHTVQQESEH